MSDTRKIVDQAISEALAEALPDIGEVDRRRELTTELGLDSVQVMNLVMEIEDRLDLSVPIEVLAEVRTLDQLAAKLAGLMEQSRNEPV